MLGSRVVVFETLPLLHVIFEDAITTAMFLRVISNLLFALASATFSLRLDLRLSGPYFEKTMQNIRGRSGTMEVMTYRDDFLFVFCLFFLLLLPLFRPLPLFSWWSVDKHIQVFSCVALKETITS